MRRRASTISSFRLARKDVDHVAVEEWIDLSLLKRGRFSEQIFHCYQISLFASFFKSDNGIGIRALEMKTILLLRRCLR